MGVYLDEVDYKWPVLELNEVDRGTILDLEIWA